MHLFMAESCRESICLPRLTYEVTDDRPSCRDPWESMNIMTIWRLIIFIKLRSYIFHNNELFLVILKIHFERILAAWCNYY